MNELTTTELLDRAKNLSTAAENMFLSLAVTLADIEETKAFKGLGYEKYDEYVEGELNRSKSTASKLLKVGRFIKASGFTPEKLETTYPRIYSSLNLLGPSASPKEVLAHAIGNTESELINKQKSKKAGPHEPNFVKVCTVCSVDEWNHD